MDQPRTHIISREKFRSADEGGRIIGGGMKVRGAGGAVGTGGNGERFDSENGCTRENGGSIGGRSGGDGGIDAFLGQNNSLNSASAKFNGGPTSSDLEAMMDGGRRSPGSVLNGGSSAPQGASQV